MRQTPACGLRAPPRATRAPCPPCPLCPICPTLALPRWFLHTLRAVMRDGHYIQHMIHNAEAAAYKCESDWAPLVPH